MSLGSSHLLTEVSENDPKFHSCHSGGLDITWKTGNILELKCYWNLHSWSCLHLHHDLVALKCGACPNDPRVFVWWGGQMHQEIYKSPDLLLSPNLLLWFWSKHEGTHFTLKQVPLTEPATSLPCQKGYFHSLGLLSQRRELPCCPINKLVAERRKMGATL